MEAGAREMYEDVFGDQLPEPVLTTASWSEEHVRYFAERSSQLDLPALDNLLNSIAAARSS
jgi:hypothetical protein